MAMNKSTPNNIDEYITAFPKEVQKLLEKMRTAIKKAAPSAEETISYQMPAYRLNGILVYFAAFKNHIGFYPTSSGIAAFKEELAAFEGSKGAVKFPFGQPIPFGLVSKIVQFRVKENLQRAAIKK